MGAGTLDGVIEQMCDDELGVISPVRVYLCTIDDQGPPLPHVTYRTAHGVPMLRGYVYTAWQATERDVINEVDCARCEDGPLLWDHWRQQTYVLTPYVIIEEEF